MESPKNIVSNLETMYNNYYFNFNFKYIYESKDFIFSSHSDLRWIFKKKGSNAVTKETLMI